MPAPCENHPNLFSAKYLPIFSKDLTDQKAVFLPAFLKLGIRSFVAKNVIAECAAWYLQCFAESMDIILPTGNAPLFPGPTPGRASAILIFITQGVKCIPPRYRPLTEYLYVRCRTPIPDERPLTHSARRSVLSAHSDIPTAPSFPPERPPAPPDGPGAPGASHSRCRSSPAPSGRR